MEAFISLFSSFFCFVKRLKISVSRIIKQYCVIFVASRSLCLLLSTRTPSTSRLSNAGSCVFQEGSLPSKAYFTISFRAKINKEENELKEDKFCIFLKFWVQQRVRNKTKNDTANLEGAKCDQVVLRQLYVLQKNFHFELWQVSFYIIFLT